MHSYCISLKTNESPCDGRSFDPKSTPFLGFLKVNPIPNLTTWDHPLWSYAENRQTGKQTIVYIFYFVFYSPFFAKLQHDFYPHRIIFYRVNKRCIWSCGRGARSKSSNTDKEKRVSVTNGWMKINYLHFDILGGSDLNHLSVAASVSLNIASVNASSIHYSIPVTLLYSSCRLENQPWSRMARTYGLEQREMRTATT